MKNSNTTKTAKPLPTLQELAQNLRSDCYYFFSQFGLGDIYYLLGLKQALEQKYSDKIIFIIKPGHEVVLELFGYEYILVQEPDTEMLLSKFIKIWEFDNISISPKPGKIFPVHQYPLKKSLGVVKNVLDIVLKILDLPSNTKVTLPTNLPKISPALQIKLNKIAPLNKIILFCPNAHTLLSLPPLIFKDECTKLRTQGFFIVVNIHINPIIYKSKPHFKRIDYEKHFIEGVIALDLSLKDLIALGISCAGVISARSGFCDIIAPHCKNLKVYYTDLENYWWSRFANVKSSLQEIYIKEVPIYKEFLHFLNNLLPLKLYKLYIAKGFLKRLRTPFTAYFNIYKKHKANETQNEIKPSIKQELMRDFSRDFGLNETEIVSEIQSELESSYEYQLGILLEKACKAFWCGGFLAFPFAYLKLRKQKKKLTRLNEIL